MINISLIAAAGVLALFGWGWVGKIFHLPPGHSESAKVEQRLKDEGAIKSDGTILVDKDFDAELNAELKEMDSIDRDNDTQLQGLENQK